MSEDDNKDNKVVPLTAVKTELKNSGPKWEPDMEAITDRALVVDRNGVAWWVDPYARLIKKVEFE